MTITPSSRPKPRLRRPPSPPSPPLIHRLLLLSATVLSKSAAINLDIHIPVPTGGCVMEEALRANLLLRDASPARSSSSSSSSSPVDGNSTRSLPEIEPPSEHIDLFVQHTPHVTLFLSDFDLETNNATLSTSSDGRNDDATNAHSSPLNQTKLQQFLDTISSLNVTHLTHSMDCSLSYTTNPTTTHTQTPSSPLKYYTLSGPYAMLPIQTTSCLQTLSSHIYHALQPFLRRPIVVPSWVASLPEPERSRAIYRCREYGSPNVGEGFVPHVSVGFDPPLEGVAKDLEGDWRVEVMEEWNEGHAAIQGKCVDQIGGIAVGKTGEGGTVLANGRLGYWDLGGVARSENYVIMKTYRLGLRSREPGESVE